MDRWSPVAGGARQAASRFPPMGEGMEGDAQRMPERGRSKPVSSGVRWLPLLAASLVVALAVAVAWSVVSVRPARDPRPLAIPTADPAVVRAVAYVAHEPSGDVVYVRDPRSELPPRELLRLPRPFDVKAGGAAGPLGSHLAVLSFTSAGRSRLHIVALPSGDLVTIEGGFDLAAPVAWDWDESRLAVASVESVRADGRRVVAVNEVRLGGELRTVAEFTDIFQAAPVGYSPDGSKLYVVVLDPTGSVLWSVANDGAAVPVARLSAGPTSAWRLSPDGTQLAFLEVTGAETASYRGRLLTISSGAVADVPASGNQLGVAWSPRSLIPQFGGPGGTVWLSGTDPNSTYLIPAAWSPDASALLAEVVDAETGTVSLEVVWAEGRLPLSSSPATPLGWVASVA